VGLATAMETNDGDRNRCRPLSFVVAIDCWCDGQEKSSKIITDVLTDLANERAETHGTQI
jgi:hypothetical protein